MHSCISVKNSSSLPISVYTDDVLLVSNFDSKKSSICKSVECGSIRITVFDIREQLLFDIWVSVAPSSRHTLEIFDTGYTFKSIPFP